MEITKTKLDGVLHIQLKVHEDSRGKYVESYNENRYKENGIGVDFVEHDFSISKKNVLRGIHADNAAWKIIDCPNGKFYIVAVNCDEDSKNFGEWVSYTFEGGDGQQMLIPPKHGLAHLALTDDIVFYYKQSEYYDPRRQTSYRWDEPRFGVEWPIDNPILSKRDELADTSQVIK